MHVLSRFRRAGLLATLRTVAGQAPVSMEFSRQDHCSGLPIPTPGNLPNPGIKSAYLICPALAGGLFTVYAALEYIKMLYQLVGRRVHLK